MTATMAEEVMEGEEVGAVATGAMAAMVGTVMVIDAHMVAGTEVGMVAGEEATGIGGVDGTETTVAAGGMEAVAGATVVAVGAVAVMAAASMVRLYASSTPFHHVFPQCLWSRDCTSSYAFSSTCNIICYPHHIELCLHVHLMTLLIQAQVPTALQILVSRLT